MDGGDGQGGFVADGMLVVTGGHGAVLPELADAAPHGRRGNTAEQLEAAAVLGVSLVYDVTLIAIAQLAALGGPQTTTAVMAYGLFAAVEHMFLIAPPAQRPARW